MRFPASAALRELREAGVIRHVGLSNVSVDQFAAAREIVPIAAVTQRFNLLEQDSADLLAATRASGAVFSPWFPTGVPSGIASAVAVTEVTAALGVSLPQLSLAWLLHRSPNIVVIPGTSRRDHLAENIRAAETALTAAEFAALSQNRPLR